MSTLLIPVVPVGTLLWDRSYYVAQVGLKLKIFPFLLPGCWDRHVPPCLATSSLSAATLQWVQNAAVAWPSQQRQQLQAALLCLWAVGPETESMGLTFGILMTTGQRMEGKRWSRVHGLHSQKERWRVSQGLPARVWALQPGSCGCMPAPPSTCGKLCDFSFLLS